MLIPADSEAVAHGVGLFETILVENGRAFFVNEHYERLAASAAALGFPPPDRAPFDDEVAKAIGTCALRILYVDAGEWQLTSTTSPIPPMTLARREHGRAITLDPSFARSLPRHKLTSYAVCVVALREAQQSGADEALFVTRDGGYLEGTSTNVFAISNGRLITTPLTAGILPGVTRAWVIAEARKLGIEVESRVPSREDLLAGSFLTGSLTKLAPIRRLDGAECPDSLPILSELQRAWSRIE